MYITMGKAKKKKKKKSNSFFEIPERGSSSGVSL
jgi:hypothetical protein